MGLSRGASALGVAVAGVPSSNAPGRFSTVRMADTILVVGDAEIAMQEGAPQLHPNTPNNIISHYRIRTGDMEAAWQEAAVVVEGVYQTAQDLNLR